jgi:hypothetical protein
MGLRAAARLGEQSAPVLAGRDRFSAKDERIRKGCKEKQPRIFTDQKQEVYPCEPVQIHGGLAFFGLASTGLFLV